jgi:signal transduction histidine kinase
MVIMLISMLAYKTYQFNRQITKAHKEITEQKEEIQAQSEELKEANQTIALINRQLEQRIEDRTAALKQAYKELDIFFYRSSHDFRRPLTTFLGLAEVAKITVKDPNALELFAKVRDTANTLDKMLVKLQSISDVGAQQLVYREVFLQELFDSVCADFRDMIMENHIRIISEIHLTRPFYAYPAMVQIIIENLVENSISFRSPEHPYVKFSAFEEKGNVILEVEDNGQGIEEQYHDRIFEMYFRGSDRSKGNGLGLYIVKKAVEKLGGSITFYSGLYEGSRFSVSLPGAQEAVGHTASTSEIKIEHS